MSDLKHQTPAELRSLIKWCEHRRKEHEVAIDRKKAEAARITQELAEHGKSIHNIGQKEAWARIYLARKELGE